MQRTDSMRDKRQWREAELQSKGSVDPQYMIGICRDREGELVFI
jgi:hypothetical protein